MTDIILIFILAAAGVIAVWQTVKHFRGKGGCCGGGGYRIRAKKLSNVLYTKKFRVDGMHCDHCKARVEEIVNDMKGVAGKVDLKSGTLTVSYAEDVPDDGIISRIERIGYHVHPL